MGRRLFYDYAVEGLRYPIRMLERSMGKTNRKGTDHAHNFQLLCGHCNSVKGKKTQAEFMAIMAEKRTDYSWM